MFFSDKEILEIKKSFDILNSNIKNYPSFFQEKISSDDELSK